MNLYKVTYFLYDSENQREMRNPDIDTLLASDVRDAMSRVDNATDKVISRFHEVAFVSHVTLPVSK